MAIESIARAEYLIMEKADECSICWEEIPTGTRALVHIVSQTAAQHLFHEICLGEALRRSPTCPITRIPLQLPVSVDAPAEANSVQQAAQAVFPPVAPTYARPSDGERCLLPIDFDEITFASSSDDEYVKTSKEEAFADLSWIELSPPPTRSRVIAEMCISSDDDS
ncbi:MAG: RING finger protein [Chlamydiales bacterium]|nr:RING finger protein [Chlamydiales bacterium]